MSPPTSFTERKAPNTVNKINQSPNLDETLKKKKKRKETNQDQNDF